MFKWFRLCYSGKIKTEGFLEYIAIESENVIKEFTISIPIPFLNINTSMEIGTIKLDYYNEEFFNNYEKRLHEIEELDRNKISEVMSNLRRKYQGTVFSCIKIEAEENKAIEIAIEDTEKALTVLRFFSPSALIPEIPSYLGRMGHTLLPSNYIFIFNDNDDCPVIREEIDDHRQHYWTLDESYLNIIREKGFHQAIEIIFKENKSEFEKCTINAIEIFCRATMSKDYYDKIVYSLVAAETLLLKNNSEGIQSNTGLRMSFVIKTNPDDRNEIRKLINNAYSRRSAFLHHGNKNIDRNLLSSLQMAVWDTIRMCLLNCKTYNTQIEFINYIETQIVS